VQPKVYQCPSASEEHCVNAETNVLRRCTTWLRLQNKPTTSLRLRTATADWHQCQLAFWGWHIHYDKPNGVNFLGDSVNCRWQAIFAALASLAALLAEQWQRC
jgi:hypothetical protein